MLYGSCTHVANPYDTCRILYTLKKLWGQGKRSDHQCQEFAIWWKCLMALSRKLLTHMICAIYFIYWKINCEDKEYFLQWPEQIINVKSFPWWKCFIAPAPHDFCRGRNILHWQSLIKRIYMKLISTEKTNSKLRLCFAYWSDKIKILLKLHWIIFGKGSKEFNRFL